MDVARYLIFSEEEVSSSCVFCGMPQIERDKKSVLKGLVNERISDEIPELNVDLASVPCKHFSLISHLLGLSFNFTA